jgi:hypothetical protein
MDSSQAALVTAILAAVAAVVASATAIVLGRRLRQAAALVEELRAHLVPLARHAQLAAEQAATELERVGDVLGSAEAVSATVDAASRLAYRAFANPAVKTVAYATGFRGALRRLVGRSPELEPSAPAIGELARRAPEQRPGRAHGDRSVVGSRPASP